VHTVKAGVIAFYICGIKAFAVVFHGKAKLSVLISELYGTVAALGMLGHIVHHFFEHEKQMTLGYQIQL
jgi:hypothetical protein